MHLEGRLIISLAPIPKSTIRKYPNLIISYYMNVRKNFLNQIFLSLIVISFPFTVAGSVKYSNGLEFGVGVGSEASVMGIDKNNPPVYCKIPDYLFDSYFGKNIYVTRIEDSALKGCTSLKSIDIPKYVYYIGESAFADCKYLESISLKDCYDTSNKFNSFTIIRKSTFAGCTNLTTIKLPLHIEDIYEFAFAESGLTTIELSPYIKRIFDNAFYNCNKLDSVFISQFYPEEIDYWCGIDFASETANPLTYARTLVVNGDPVSTLTIGREVDIIRKYAFNNSNVKQIIIPTSVCSIEDYAFNGTRPYAIVSRNSYPPQITENVFSDYSAILYVPENAINAYTSHAIWGRFTKVRPIPTDDIHISLCSDKSELYVGESEKLSVIVFKPTGVKGIPKISIGIHQMNRWQL